MPNTRCGQALYCYVLWQKKLVSTIAIHDDWKWFFTKYSSLIHNSLLEHKCEFVIYPPIWLNLVMLMHLAPKVQIQHNGSKHNFDNSFSHNLWCYIKSKVQCLNKWNTKLKKSNKWIIMAISMNKIEHSSNVII